MYKNFKLNTGHHGTKKNVCKIVKTKLIEID